MLLSVHKPFTGLYQCLLGLHQGTVFYGVSGVVLEFWVCAQTHNSIRGVRL